MPSERQPTDPSEIERYGAVACAAHWLVAGLAVVVVALGWLIPGTARGGDSRELVLLLHRSLGLVILALMLFRIFWRLTHSAPPLPAGFPRIEALAAYADHALRYVLFLVMPTSTPRQLGIRSASSACSRSF